MEKLHHTEQEFWSSSYEKIDYILERYMEELTGTRQETQEIQSMKEIMGW